MLDHVCASLEEGKSGVQIEIVQLSTVGHPCCKSGTERERLQHTFPFE